MVTKELQHGRLAILAAAGCMAQELTIGASLGCRYSMIRTNVPPTPSSQPDVLIF